MRRNSTGCSFSWHSSVSTVTLVYVGTIRCSNPDRNMKYFSFSKRTNRVRGPHSFEFHRRREVLSPGIKQSGRGAYRLTKSSAEVKNEWMYTSTPPPHVFIVCTADLQSYAFSDVGPKNLLKTRFEEFLSSSPGRFFVIRLRLPVLMCICLSVHRLTLLQLLTAGSHSLPKCAIPTESLPTDTKAHTQ
jgi:hypothetical protein